MSALAAEKLTDKEVVVNGTTEVDGQQASMESKPKMEHENALQSTESFADWFVLVCVFLTHVMNGLNYAGYSVLYLPITEIFDSSRAAVGWIQSFDFALGTFLSKLNGSVTEFYFLSVNVAVAQCLAVQAAQHTFFSDVGCMYLVIYIYMGCRMA